MIDKFRKIEKSGICPPLPGINNEDRITVRGKRLSSRDFELYDDYVKLYSSYRKTREKVPKVRVLYEELQKKYALSITRIEEIVVSVRSYRRKKKSQES